MVCEIIKKYQSLNYLILGGDISILSGEKHVMPNIDKYFNAVVKWLKPRLKTGHNTYTPPKNIFDGLDAFFETATITINITLMDVDTLSQQSQTKPQKTPTLTNNGKLDNIDINISVTSNEKFLWFELASAFYHEMLHAYEDWNRIKKKWLFVKSCKLYACLKLFLNKYNKISPNRWRRRAWTNTIPYIKG